MILYILAELNLQGYIPVAIDEQPWSVNKLDLKGYSIRGTKCCKTIKATVPSMTLTLAITPYEIIGLSFVVKSNLAIYFGDFMQDVCIKLRELQRNTN